MENANLSLFEKLPSEIRNQIYRSCLIHDENEIIPVPTDYEVNSLRKMGKKVPSRPHDGRGSQAPTNAKIEYGSYHPKWPAVALLGVNRKVHSEVLAILFGENTWRLSCQYTCPLSYGLQQRPLGHRRLHDPYLYWKKYADHFRNLNCIFSAMDLSHDLLVRTYGQELRNQTTRSRQPLNHRHETLLGSLHLGPMAEKWSCIEQMESLSRIRLWLGTLACPMVCCRNNVLEELMRLGKEDMVLRLRTWAPTESLIIPAASGFFSLFVKGSQHRILSVEGLWSKDEAEMLLEHWWQPTQQITETEPTPKKPTE